MGYESCIEVTCYSAVHEIRLLQTCVVQSSCKAKSVVEVTTEGGKVRQAGSIYLKNFLKRNWDIAPEQGGVQMTAAACWTTKKEDFLRTTAKMASRRPIFCRSLAI